MKSELFRALNITSSDEGKGYLRNLNLSVGEGEILGVFGTYDSGKTALFDVITGKREIRSGLLLFRDKSFREGGRRFPGVRLARISEDSSLFQGLSVWENLELLKSGERLISLVHPKRCIRKMVRALEEFHMDINPTVNPELLSPFHRFLLEILRAYLTGINFILVEDFSSELSLSESLELRRFLEKIKEKGISLIIMSRRISLLREWTDRIAFLRSGRIVRIMDTEPLRNGGESASLDRVLLSLLPESRAGEYDEERERTEVFTARGLELDLRSKASFTLYKGEIVLFFDPFKETAALLEAVLRRGNRDRFALMGKPVKKKVWRDNILFTDFKINGKIFQSLSPLENISLPMMGRYSRWGIRKPPMEKFISREFSEWYRNGELMERKNSVGLSERESEALILFRLRLARPTVLFCRDPGTDTDDIAMKLVYQELADMARTLGTAVFIIVTDKENLENVADRYLVVSEDNTLEEVPYGDIFKRIYRPHAGIREGKRESVGAE